MTRMSTTENDEDAKTIEEGLEHLAKCAAWETACSSRPNPDRPAGQELPYDHANPSGMQDCRSQEGSMSNDGQEENNDEDGHDGERRGLEHLADPSDVACKIAGVRRVA